MATEFPKVRRIARVAGDSNTEIDFDGMTFEDAAKALYDDVSGQFEEEIGVAPAYLEVEVCDPDDGAGWRKFRVQAVTHLEVIGLRGGE